VEDSAEDSVVWVEVKLTILARHKSLAKWQCHMLLRILDVIRGLAIHEVAFNRNFLKARPQCQAKGTTNRTQRQSRLAAKMISPL
jgi:hypothetical protein